MDDDPLLAVLRLFPFVFAAAGVALVAWMARARLPTDLEQDVLAALSETEALSVTELCRRAPLAGTGADPDTVTVVLVHLCQSGLVVRWYAEALRNGQTGSQHRQPVYRRVGRGGSSTC